MSKWLGQKLPSLMEPLARRKIENGRWRRMGLLRDDLITDEHDVTQEALHRIPKSELHGRYARFKIALQYSMMRRELPKDQWVTNEQDKVYLMPFVEQVLAEHTEREKYDNGVFERAK
jgi:ubiquinol-cytochrome c reductase subunit 7